MPIPTVRSSLSAAAAACLLAAALVYGCSDDTADAPPPLGGSSSGAVGPRDSGGGGDAVSDTASPDSARAFSARATLAPTGLPDAGTVTGTVAFDESGGRVAVSITVSGATRGLHAVHIHANGACGVDDAGVHGGAAGGHWNPNGVAHGYPDAAVHHPGDFGNVSVDSAGNGTLTLTTTAFTVNPAGGALSAVGKAVVFHQGADDGTTQPTGNAGGRAACGIIEP